MQARTGADKDAVPVKNLVSLSKPALERCGRMRPAVATDRWTVEWSPELGIGKKSLVRKKDDPLDGNHAQVGDQNRSAEAVAGDYD